MWVEPEHTPGHGHALRPCRAARDGGRYPGSGSGAIAARRRQRAGAAEHQVRKFTDIGEYRLAQPVSLWRLISAHSAGWLISAPAAAASAAFHASTFDVSLRAYASSTTYSHRRSACA